MTSLSISENREKKGKSFAQHFFTGRQEGRATLLAVKRQTTNSHYISILSGAIMQDITTLLLAWRDGDPEALGQLMPLVYEELRQIARRHLSEERQGHTLQTTALVNEAYLRLVNLQTVQWKDRVHFYSYMANVMRHVLVDFARARKNQKRGGGNLHETGGKAEAMEQGEHSIEDVLAVHEALGKLMQHDSRCGKVVEMRFFGGLTYEEIAEVLGVTDRTVKNEWSYARLWLQRELRHGAGY